MPVLVCWTASAARVALPGCSSDGIGGFEEGGGNVGCVWRASVGVKSPCSVSERWSSKESDGRSSTERSDCHWNLSSVIERCCTGWFVDAVVTAVLPPILPVEFAFF